MARFKTVINEGVNLTKDTDVATQITSEATLPSSGARSPQQTVMAIAVTVVIVVIAILLWLMRPPLDQYTQSVLNLSGDPVQGRSIFVMNCVACHGQWANGKVGPDLHGVSDRKSDARLVQQVVSGETPPMPQFQPSPQDMADLLSYLKQL
ncbi:MULTISPECIES: c-type cytochrome [Pseudanabaena]|uniref:Cytochrome c class I n=2 Tax=Pseudanabaena TaxID=1152 RepID=L8MR33_9CYAN|nr:MULTISPECIES: cytochrome c [Pseudanabaena]ELS30357.1 cytochrome c class I [Pseudanabaena biceps PCC 7429]MDG3497366.1 cytochrome c [Pseudanabaena catenata USMAC16]